MAEGLKIVGEIYERAKVQHSVSVEAYLGIDVAVLVLSNPVNADLLDRLVAYCRNDEELAKEQRHEPQRYSAAHSLPRLQESLRVSTTDAGLSVAVQDAVAIRLQSEVEAVSE